MIELGGVEKVYPRGSELVHALRGIDLVLSKGEFVSIIGHSGSGKTTLLQIIGCLDKPTRGSLKIDGRENSSRLSDIPDPVRPPFSRSSAAWTNPPGEASR